MWICSDEREHWQLAQACLAHLGLCLKTLLVPGVASAGAGLARDVLHDLHGEHPLLACKSVCLYCARCTGLSASICMPVNVTCVPESTAGSEVHQGTGPPRAPVRTLRLACSWLVPV